MGVWGGAALPVITQLIDDLAAIAGPGTRTASVPPAVLRQEAAGLRRDVTRAQSLKQPPDQVLAAEWTVTLRQLASDEIALDGSTTRPDAATLNLIRQQFGIAAEGLLQIGQRVRSDA